MDTTSLSIDWLPLLAIAGTTAVMFILARRLMRGMNQQDWILLRQARRNGIDINREQNVSFVVFAATHETASELLELMQKDGFDASIKPAQIQYARNKRNPGQAQEGWLVTGQRKTRLVPEELSRIRKSLDDIALERKAAYLGWQVSLQAVQPQQAADPAK